jgi:hypothetical protein
MTYRIRTSNPRGAHEFVTRRRAMCMVCKESFEIPGAGVCYECNTK